MRRVGGAAPPRVPRWPPPPEGGGRPAGLAAPRPGAEPRGAPEVGPGAGSRRGWGRGEG